MTRPVRPDVPALILGKGLTALGALRALTADGVETLCVDSGRDIITRSRHYRAPAQRLAESGDSDELAAYLARLPVEGAVLMPCSDGWVAAVGGLPPQVRQRFPASIPPRGSIDQLLDKASFLDLVSRLGIPHPRTTRLAGPAALEALTDEDLLGAFLKPTDSARHNAVFGTKGFFVESRAAAAARLEAGAASGVAFLLQEWIPGPVGNTILIDGFVDRHGSILTAIARRRVRMNPPRLGNTTAAVSVSLESVAPGMSIVRKLLEAVPYRGVFNAEFKVDERDRTFRIIEVNPRLAWHTATLRGMGIDLSRMAYLDALEQEVPRPAGYRVGRYVVCDTPDAIAIARSLGARQRPDGPILKPWLLGSHVIFSWADPLPFAVDVWRAGAGRARAIRRSLLSRVARRASGPERTADPRPLASGPEAASGTNGAAERRNS